jgi:hypothetical protein
VALVSLNKELLKTAITSKAERVLFKTGAYALTTMRRNIRAAKKAKQFYTVQFGSRKFLVPRVGKVLDAKTKRPVSALDAETARHLLKQQLTTEAAGQPPRRGPSDLLRELMKFTVDLTTYTVSAGPILFSKQPKLVGAQNVPELLEFGGGEYRKDQLVHYQPRPFIAPAVQTTQTRMEQLIESEQLRP